MVERNGQVPLEPESQPFTQVQRLHLELIRLTSYNDCDGAQVAADLEAYPELWRAAMMGNFGKGNELAALRDMEQGFYNVDTLMILTTKEHMPAIEELAWRWQAPDVGWLSKQETARMLGVYPTGRLRVLRVWWRIG